MLLNVKYQSSEKQWKGGEKPKGKNIKYEKTPLPGNIRVFPGKLVKYMDDVRGWCVCVCSHSLLKVVEGLTVGGIIFWSGGYWRENQLHAS